MGQQPRVIRRRSPPRRARERSRGPSLQVLCRRASRSTLRPVLSPARPHHPAPPTSPLKRPTTSPLPRPSPTRHPYRSPSYRRHPPPTALPWGSSEPVGEEELQSQSRFPTMALKRRQQPPPRICPSLPQLPLQPKPPSRASKQSCRHSSPRLQRWKEVPPH